MKLQTMLDMLDPKPEPQTPMTMDRFMDLLGDSNKSKPVKTCQRMKSVIEFGDRKS